MSHNFLNGRNRRALEDLILKCKEEIEKGEWSQPSFASFAEKKLGATVTHANVKRAAEVVDVKFPGGRTLAKSHDLKEVEAAIRLLAGELVELAGELGKRVSPTLEALADYGKGE